MALLLRYREVGWIPSKYIRTKTEGKEESEGAGREESTRWVLFPSDQHGGVEYGHVSGGAGDVFAATGLEDRIGRI